MKLQIECECGNVFSMKAQNGKYLQLRDNLETKQFRYDGAEIDNGKLKEIRIRCDNCGRWISLGVD